MSSTPASSHAQPLSSARSFENALRHQPKSFPDHEYVKPVAAAIFVVGQILVLSSTWALGVTGTYLGDYCGILQDKMGTSETTLTMMSPARAVAEIRLSSSGRLQ